MLHSILIIPENEGDSKNLKKVQELIQHLVSNVEIVPKQNITCKRWRKIRKINYEEKREKD